MAEKYSGSIEMGVSSSNHEVVVSDSVEHAVICPNGHDGTAMALAKTVEDSGETVHTIRLRDDRDTLDCKQISVKANGAVPSALHSQLTEWGYSTNDNPGEDIGNGAHVYNDYEDRR
jgi:hypothetical protein